MRRKVFAMLATMVVATAALIGVTPSPAAAHRNVVEVTGSGGNVLARGTVSKSHLHVATCDTKRDGRSAITYYILANGSVGSVRDANGSKSGCTNRKVTTQRNRVVWIDVCAVGKGDSICRGKRA